MSEESIFIAALSFRTPEEQARYLDDACRDNPTLRSGVESLLAAHREDAIRTAPMMPATVVERDHGLVIGSYKLRERIGEGGMGTVYIAEQERPVRRKVALKIIKLGMDTHQVVARFEAERQALALMDHPFIAKVLDAGATDAGRPFFVMELVRGLPITDFCRQAKLATRDRLRLFVDVCQAVQHAHQKGIIHRDLKPSNVLVGEVDGKPVPKVIDFGVAKATGQQLTDHSLYTAHGQLVGTPLYMSPEQTSLSGVDVDTRSDVYSLGVVLYELLTGTTPVSKETLSNVSYDELRRIIREDDPPRPSARVSTLNAAADPTAEAVRQFDAAQLSRQLRGELDWIVMRSLEKDRNRRYESPSALAADIERFLRDEPVLACPPSWQYLAGKAVRRHKGLLTTATLVAVALLMGLAAALWQADEADRARRLAEDRERNEATARKEAEDEKQRAQTNFDIAKQAVAQMLTRVADDQLSTIPGMKEVREKLLNDAIKLYSDLIALQPDDSDTYRERAEVSVIMRSPDAAIADFERAIALNPRDYRSLVRLGQYYGAPPGSHKVDVVKGLGYVEQAIQLEPERAWGYRVHAELLIKHGQREAALKQIENFRRLDPESSAKYRRIAQLLMRLGDQAGQMAAIQKAVELDPNDPATLRQVATWTVEGRHDDEALAIVNRAIEAQPKQENDAEFVHLLESRAGIYERRQQYDKVLADATRAIEMMPMRSYAYKRRAKAHFHLGRPAEALADLRKSMEINPQDPSALTWIPAHQVATVTDPAFRAEFLKFADDTVERSGQATLAIDGRALIREMFSGATAALSDLLVLIEREPQRFEWRWHHALLNILDTAEYPRVCTDTLKRFQDTTDPATAAIVVWTCGIAPGGLEDYAPALRMAERSAETAGENRQRHTALGAVQLRAGRLEEARATLLRVRDFPADAGSSPAALEYLLALTEHRLDHRAEALEHLRQANELAEPERAADLTGIRALLFLRWRTEAEAEVSARTEPPKP